MNRNRQRLALDCYYDRLGEQSVRRMLNGFEEYAAIDYASQRKFFDDARPGSLFDTYRNGTYGGVLTVIG